MAQMSYNQFFYNIVVEPRTRDATPEQEITVDTNMYIRLCDIEFNFVGEGKIVAITLVNAETQNFRIKLEKDGLATEYLSDNFVIIHFIDPVDESVSNALSQITEHPALYNRKVVFWGHVTRLFFKININIISIKCYLFWYNI